MGGRVDEDWVTFTWDGQEVPGRPDEPVAVALWRAGIRTQTRSIKYHRARGPQCFTGGCPGCMVRIDGVPNQRGCRRPVVPGATVESQVGRPTAQRDLFSVVDRVFGHLDHERDFVRPAPVRAVYEAIARRMAGFGDPPTSTVPTHPGERLNPDLLIAGGGPAGLGAAHEAATGDMDVLLVDPGPLGGSLLHTPTTVDGGAFGKGPGPELANALSSTLPDTVEHRAGQVLGLFEDGALVVEGHGSKARVHHVTPAAVLLATGAHEGAVLVPGNDRPGVLGARAARVLLNRWGVVPGGDHVVVDPGPEGRALATELGRRGLPVTVTGPIKTIGGDPEAAWVRTEAGERVEGDTVVLDGGLAPAVELAQQAGIPLTYQDELGGRVPLHRADGTTPVPNAFVAGSIAGVHDPAAALLQGRLAGATAAGLDPPLKPTRLLEAKGVANQAARALQRIWGRP